jgi:fumarate reductase subunit D
MLACVSGCHVFIVHLFHRKELVFAMFMPVSILTYYILVTYVVSDEWLILWSLHTTGAVCRLCVCVNKVVMLLGYMLFPNGLSSDLNMCTCFYRSLVNLVVQYSILLLPVYIISKP